MIKLENKPGVTAPTATYPYGKSKDNSGTNDGFPLNSANLEDYHQFFAKMFSVSGLTANGLPDNNDNGFQLYNALRKITKPYKLFCGTLTQTGTSAPVFTVFVNELGGTPVWTRSGAGIYNATLTGVFIGKVGIVTDQTGNSANSIRASYSTNIMQIFSANGGTLQDNLLLNTYFELKIFD
jgi:hypothetical protein